MKTLGNRSLKLNKETLRTLSGAELLVAASGMPIDPCSKGNQGSCQGDPTTISGTDNCTKGELSCACG